MTINLNLMSLGEIMDDIELEDIHISPIYGTTTLYFIAPKELTMDKYPDPDHSEIAIEFPTDSPNPDEANVCISPTKFGTDYDWTDIILPFVEVEKLISIGLEKIKGEV